MNLPYERVAISSLQYDPRNARKHDKRNLKAIKDSLTKFGQQKPIVIGDDNTVIAGNGTLAAARELGWETIDVRRSGLKADEAIAYGLADNRSAELAEWDNDTLGTLLSELDGTGWDLDGLGWDSKELDKLVYTGEDADDDLYSSKIEAPIYKVTGEKPNIEDLYDGSKTEDLLMRIKNSNAPEDAKTFLTVAAYRHTVFSFDKVAEYYAHADKVVQALFEESALVIIDFEKAIENGFVKMSKDIAANYREDFDDGL